MKQIICTILLAALSFVSVMPSDLAPDLTQIRIKENPGEKLEYIGKIGDNFDTALDYLRELKSITSEIVKEPLEVLFDYDDRSFFGIVYGECAMYSDVLDTEGNYYLRTWYSPDDENNIAHIDSNYFPTGMEWEETSVDIGLGKSNASSTIHYEIGEETTVDEQLYRKVLINSAESSLLIREDGSEVWLLTNEYPEEIKLYDFDWEKNETLQSEFLIKTNGEWTLEKQEIQPEYKQTVVGAHSYEYYQDADLSTVIREIGRVADRSRNSCLLGYKEPETILPGQTYNKVTWVKRMGEEIFRSDDGEEWITYIPGSPETSIPDAASLSKSKSGSGKTYTIGGQQTKASRRGIYIRDGEKFVVK